MLNSCGSLVCRSGNAAEQSNRAAFDKRVCIGVLANMVKHHDADLPRTDALGQMRLDMRDVQAAGLTWQSGPC